METETVLEQGLHLESVTRIEEEKQTPKTAVNRRDEAKDSVEAVTKLLNQMSVITNSVKTVGTNQFSGTVDRRQT